LLDSEDIARPSFEEKLQWIKVQYLIFAQSATVTLILVHWNFRAQDGCDKITVLI
jgi:hypothetical protein